MCVDKYGLLKLVQGMELPSYNIFILFQLLVAFSFQDIFEVYLKVAFQVCSFFWINAKNLLLNQQ